MKVTKFNLNSILLSSSLALLPSFGYAADLEDQEILNVEQLYKKDQAAPVQQRETVTTPTPEVTKPETTAETTEKAPKVDQKVERLIDLNKLSPFQEVSVLQKKYLPKTERFQLFAGLGTTTNSPWFLNLGAKINAGYFFTETFGIEFSGIFLSNSERQVAKEIRDNNNLQPEKFVNTKSYMGLDVVFAPIYGKLSLLNARIVPFDMYFSFGGGSSNTNSVEGNVTTFHVGTGQIFAISKAMAFRWDYSWTSFNATPVGTNQQNSYNDLILTAGVSFFFPEAKYR